MNGHRAGPALHCYFCAPQGARGSLTKRQLLIEPGKHHCGGGGPVDLRKGAGSVEFV